MSRPEPSAEAGPSGSGGVRELLSAWLDGELELAEAEAVVALVERDPDAKAEFEAARTVRAMLRELPQVEPPAGFYERLLECGPVLGWSRVRGDARGVHPHGRWGSHSAPVDPEMTRVVRRERRRRGGLVALAALGTATSFIAVVGMTPAVDRFVPPIEAFAARHEQMTASGGQPRGNDRDEASGFAVAPVSWLDTMAPTAMGEYRRVAGYRSDDVVHLVYSDGTSLVSIYEQPGNVHWRGLPNGDRMSLGSVSAWSSRRGEGEILVVERQSVVFTLIASAPHDEMVEMATRMPTMTPHVGMGERLRRACEQMIESFGLDVSDR
ncbi:MAG: hypothetical protein N2037_00930 [Acidimicrobiales bacterium]|nr:hypothetical protein [Acidimicrobiales bacterium]